jgi:hypothetical protein
MPDQTVNPRRYYVYALYRQDGTPFYIGMGTGDRWLQHERMAHRKRSHKNNLILKMQSAGITEIPKAKLYKHATKSEAIALEIELIRQIGRQPNGPLLNETDGGEGILGLSKEMLAARAAKIAEALHRPETKAKLSAAALGKKLGPRTEAQKAAISAAVKGFRHTAEAIAKIAAASRSRVVSPETRAKAAATRKANHRGYGPEVTAKALATRAARQPPRPPKPPKIDPGEFMKTLWADPDRRSTMIQTLKTAANNPATKARMSKAAKARWQKPGHREKILAAWARKKSIC